MAGNPSLTRMIHSTIYELKKRYGAPITVYRLASSSTDYETGVKSATKLSFDIQRAVILPSSEVRRFLTSISFISQSKSFVSPGSPGWDESQRAFIIDGRDLRDFSFEPEDWIVYEGKRHEVVIIESLEFNTGWLIIAKQAKGSIAERIINLNLVDTLEVSQDESETVE